MNITTLRIQMETAETLGRSMEKSKEELEKSALRLEGALSFLGRVEEDLNKLTQKVKGEVMSEESTLDFSDPLEIARYMIESIMLASRGVHDHMERAATAIPVTRGKQQGLDIAIKEAHAVFKANKERISAIEKEVESGLVAVDSAGVVEPTEGNEGGTGHHPGLSERGRALEEEAKEATEKKPTKTVSKSAAPKKQSSKKAPPKKRKRANAKKP